MSLLGDRPEQQDSYKYFISGKRLVALVCDGMGGHKGGSLASKTAIASFVGEYEKNDAMGNNIPHSLLSAIQLADKQVASLADDEGNRLRAGSTLVCVVVDNGMLHWVSAGDSRFYLVRDEKMLQVTKDHNYKMLLDERLQSGVITKEEYLREAGENGEKLISFMGVGALPYIDSNSAPIPLKSGDRLLLTSDGLYKILPDEDIERILSNFSNVSEALKALEMKIGKVIRSKKIIRDNITSVLIKIK